MVLLCYSTVWSQTRHQSGILPSISLTKKINKTSRFNLKVETRQSFYDKTKVMKADWSHANILTDITSVYSHKVGYNNSLAGGYMTRFIDGSLGHRTIQRLTIIQKLDGYRLSHRIATDQSWMPDEAIALRLRYRLATELPLQGSSLDHNEYYLKANTEGLAQLQEREAAYEFRIVPALGYQFTDNNKLETGVDLRYSNLFNTEIIGRYWLSIAWFRTF